MAPRVLAFILALAIYLPAAHARQATLPIAQLQTQPAPSVTQTPAASDAAKLQAPQNVTVYTLPPDLYKKAKALSRIRFVLNLAGFFYGLLILWLILHLKIAPKFRDWAQRASPNRFLQAAIFSPLVAATLAILLVRLISTKKRFRAPTAFLSKPGAHGGGIGAKASCC